MEEACGGGGCAAAGVRGGVHELALYRQYPEKCRKDPGSDHSGRGRDGEKGQEPTAAPAEDDYFATARLSRKQARDNAISMLKEAERDENAQQSVLNEASQTLQVLAAYTVAESQIESLVTAKGYADCVVFMGAESVSVVVAPPEGGLTATDAARIKDIVISETDYTAEQIKIMEAN